VRIHDTSGRADAPPARPATTRLLDALPAASAESAELVDSARRVHLDAGQTYFRHSFENAVIHVVEDGFVVVRATIPGGSRSIITCDAGPGKLVLPPGREEAVCAVDQATLTAVSEEALGRLLAVPLVARRILEQLGSTLAEKQEALANFALTSHVERVRRKLVQLARSYGHVGRDGIRIDFPITHALLAEMIGSSRETVTRSLHELEQERFLVRRGSSYRLLVEPKDVFEPTD
jgi:CRP/FNR family cyclic AMP-dependent transcriptional regulator